LESVEKSYEHGTIIVPETVKQTERLDYFLRAIGPAAKRAYPSLEPGVRVIVKKFHEVHIPYQGKDYILTNVDNIEGVIG
jgi:co-chaperonin GroES (HSP10)